jgi:hypothetical protein
MATIRINDPRSIRAISFLSHGQKVETWLRSGEYHNAGEVWLDSAAGIRAVMLYGLDKTNKGTFYVGVGVLPVDSQN